MEWVSGMAPEAFLFDETGSLLQSFSLPDINVEEIKTLFASKGFQLTKKKITLSEPIKTANFGQKMYNVYAEVLTQETAEMAALSAGGRLLSIESEEEDYFINSLLADENGDKHYWLSANDVVNEGVWVWHGKATFFGEGAADHQYAGWAENEPNNAGGNENCAVIKPSLSRSWYDRSCTEKHQLIVEFDLVKQEL